MSPNRMTAAVLSVLTLFTLAWRVMGTGGLLRGDHAGRVIANQLVDALVGVVFVLGAVYVWRITRSGLARTLWLMAVCIMIFTGRPPSRRLERAIARRPDSFVITAEDLVGAA